MSGISGNITSLRDFSAKLKDLPKTVGIKVATAAAPAITAAARETFDAGEDAFGTTWAPGANGKYVTLRKSGALERGISYYAIGTTLRVKLAVSYAKYQLGRRPAFPRQGDPLPASYIAALTKAANEVLLAEVSP